MNWRREISKARGNRYFPKLSHVLAELTAIDANWTVSLNADSQSVELLRTSASVEAETIPIVSVRLATCGPYTASISGCRTLRVTRRWRHGVFCAQSSQYATITEEPAVEIRHPRSKRIAFEEVEQSTRLRTFPWEDRYEGPAVTYEKFRFLLIIHCGMFRFSKLPEKQ